MEHANHQPTYQLVTNFHEPPSIGRKFININYRSLYVNFGDFIVMNPMVESTTSREQQHKFKV